MPCLTLDEVVHRIVTTEQRDYQKRRGQGEIVGAFIIILFPQVILIHGKARMIAKQWQVFIWIQRETSRTHGYPSKKQIQVQVLKNRPDICGNAFNQSLGSKADCWR